MSIGCPPTLPGDQVTHASLRVRGRRDALGRHPEDSASRARIPWNRRASRASPLRRGRSPREAPRPDEQHGSRNTDRIYSDVERAAVSSTYKRLVVFVCDGVEKGDRHSRKESSRALWAKSTEPQQSERSEDGRVRQLPQQEVPETQASGQIRLRGQHEDQSHQRYWRYEACGC